VQTEAHSLVDSNRCKKKAASFSSEVDYTSFMPGRMVKLEQVQFYRRKREVLNRFENVFHKIKHKLENPFKKASTMS